jgi:LmbE family N-acetylglucosaminyl deacetylase
MNTVRHIYLSPHIDDAALSCGGAIHQQVQAGEGVLVITVCAAPPEPGQPLSAFARGLHEHWGNAANMVPVRQAEDRAAIGLLGADLRHLAFNDAIYRGRPAQGEWFYTNGTKLFGEIHPADLSLAGTIAEAILELVPQTDETPVIYAPLAVGHHVDHQLVYEAAGQLTRMGRTVVFYEDYPYVDPAYPYSQAPVGDDKPYSLQATLAAKQAAHLQPQLRPLSETDLTAKINSVRAYTSQLDMLFGGEDAVANYIRSYTLDVGQGKPAERVWLSGYP